MQLPGGVSLSVPLADGQSASGDVSLGIRPEHLRISSDAGEGAILNGTVSVIERLGAESFAYVKTEAGQVIVKADGDVAATVGDQIPLVIDPARVHLFGADNMALTGGTPNQMSEIIVVDSFDYVIFGGTGDLAQRKIFPAFYHRELDGQLPVDARLIGVARSEMSSDAFRSRVEASLREFVAPDLIDADAISRFLNRVDYQRIDAHAFEGYQGLAARLADALGRTRVFYLATAPQLFGAIAENLHAVGLANGRQHRLVLEKPIGKDLASSQQINDEVGQYFDETQLYRIDHYLGKESVQNLLALRFSNILFETIWSKSVIDHVQITVSESVGLGDRAGYYDGAGAMRDMVQNHLLQLLCLTAMEPPQSLEE